MTLLKSLPAAPCLLFLLLPACALCMSIPMFQVIDQNCCIPDQLESGLAYAFGGAVPYSSGFGRVSYDYTSQLLAQNQSFLTTEGKVLSQGLLMVGKTKKLYIIDGATGRCTTSDLPTGVPKQCVPPNFKRVGGIYLGDPSVGRVNSQVFQASVSGANVTVLMTQERCAPMSQTILQPGNIVTIQSYFNLTNGIKDRSVFNVPPACKSRDVEHDSSVAQLLLRSARNVASPKLCNPSETSCLVFPWL